MGAEAPSPESISPFKKIFSIAGAETTSEAFYSNWLRDILPDLYKYPPDEAVQAISWALLSLSKAKEKTLILDNILLGRESHVETLAFAINALSKSKDKEPPHKDILVSSSDRLDKYPNMANTIKRIFNIASDTKVTSDNLSTYLSDPERKVGVLLITNPDDYTPEEIDRLCVEAERNDINIIIDDTTDKFDHLIGQGKLNQESLEDYPTFIADELQDGPIPGHNNLTIIKSLPKKYTEQGFHRSWVISNAVTKRKLEMAKVRDESLAMTNLLLTYIKENHLPPRIKKVLETISTEDLNTQLLNKLLELEKIHNPSLTEQNILPGASTTTDTLKLIFGSKSAPGDTILSESTMWAKYEPLAEAMERNFET